MNKCRGVCVCVCVCVSSTGEEVMGARADGKYDYSAPEPVKMDFPAPERRDSFSTSLQVNTVLQDQGCQVSVLVTVGRGFTRLSVNL